MAAVLVAGAVLAIGGCGGGSTSTSTVFVSHSNAPAKAPALPAGTVALVRRVPSALGTISKKELESEIATKFAGNQKAALNDLIEAVWDRAEAEALGISITPAEVEAELAQIKQQSFHSQQEYSEFLDNSQLTHQDVLAAVELQMLSSRLQEKLSGKPPAVSEAAVAKYYEENADTEYTQPPTRDVRVVVNEGKAEVEAAREALEADDTEAGWRAATKAYSPSTASSAGLQKEISAAFLSPALRRDIFDAAIGELIGPVKQEKNYLLLEVTRVRAGKARPLGEVRSQIRRQLGEEAQQERFAGFVAAFEERWRARTICAAGYTSEDCSGGSATQP